MLSESAEVIYMSCSLARLLSRDAPCFHTGTLPTPQLRSVPTLEWNFLVAFVMGLGAGIDPVTF